MGESGVCPDRAGSPWAAEMIQRGGERCVGERGAMERYKDRRGIGVVKVWVVFICV